MQTGPATKTSAASSLAVVTAHTTIEDRAVAFPAEARLLNKTRIALVKLGRVIRDIQRNSRQLQLPAKEQARLNKPLEIASRIQIA